MPMCFQVAAWRVYPSSFFCELQVPLWLRVMLSFWGESADMLFSSLERQLLVLLAQPCLLSQSKDKDMAAMGRAMVGRLYLPGKSLSVCCPTSPFLYFCVSHVLLRLVGTVNGPDIKLIRRFKLQVISRRRQGSCKILSS